MDESLSPEAVDDCGSASAASEEDAMDDGGGGEGGRPRAHFSELCADAPHCETSVGKDEHCDASADDAHCEASVEKEPRGE